MSQPVRTLPHGRGPQVAAGSIAFLTGLCALLIVSIVVILMGIIIWNGGPHVTWEFLTKAPEAGMTEGGIFPAIYGTVLLVIVMAIAVVPIGAMTAVYMHEYARGRMVDIIRSAVHNLAGVPSIVFGLFGLGFFIQFVGRGIDRSLYGGQLVWGQPCLLWAALTLALLTLPVVVVSTEEALRAVPDSYREGSLALGSTKWQTTWKVVIPQALPGILTGGILSVSRGAGEVAPILFTGAAYFLPELPKTLNSQFMELGYHIFVMSTQSVNVDDTMPIQYATTLVLLLLTFALNFAAILLRSRTRAKMEQS
ncbi:MAG: phosphate transport system permease protein PstA [Armatimonadota bacterium]|nr:MAG: phosphate transport system permease protein PstA [Armatimonadota bacterium]